MKFYEVFMKDQWTVNKVSQKCKGVKKYDTAKNCRRVLIGLKCRLPGRDYQDKGSIVKQKKNHGELCTLRQGI